MVKLLTLLSVIFAGCAATRQSTDAFMYKKDIFRGQTVHRIKLGLKDYSASIVPAHQGLEKASCIAKRANADFAVNGGFFHANGSPAGVLKIGGTVLSCLSKNRGALLWNDSKMIADRVNCHQENRVFSDNMKDLSEYPNILGGVPLLIYDGIPIMDFSIEKAVDRFMNSKNARTAIGIKEDKVWVVQVEGSSVLDRNTGDFKGFTIVELQQYMVNLGCDYAINLDGGGSSTMVVNGSIVNNLKKEERAVSEALVFKRKKK